MDAWLKNSLGACIPLIDIKKGGIGIKVQMMCLGCKSSVLHQSSNMKKIEQYENSIEDWR